MTPEDEEFNRIEMESRIRKEAVLQALHNENERLGLYKGIYESERAMTNKVTYEHEIVERMIAEAVEKERKKIVNECIDCLYPQLDVRYTPEELLQQAKYRKLIREHFGVSE